MLLSEIKYPSVRLRAKREGGATYIWDALRGLYLLCTPEEWVRQHIIAYLISECGFEPQSIVEEYPVSLNGTAQRADIVVFDNEAQPYILVECKADSVAIDSEVFAQAVRYNSVVKARFVVLTNALQTAIFEVCDGEYRAVSRYPHAKTSTPNLEQAE